MLNPLSLARPTHSVRAQLIFMMIFAIVAVELFRDFGVDGEYTTVQTYGVGDARWGQGKDMSWSLDHPFVENTTVISAMTPRGYHYGQEYYGTFSRALYTLFQVPQTLPQPAS